MPASVTKSKQPVGVLSQRVYHMLLYAVARDIAYQQLRSTDSGQLGKENTPTQSNLRPQKRRNNKMVS